MVFSLVQSAPCAGLNRPFYPVRRPIRNGTQPAKTHCSVTTGDGGNKARQIGTALLGSLAAGFMALGSPSVAAVQKVGDFTASGLIFKDSVEVLALDDEDVQGVTVYVSDFRRSLTDKLAKDFFAEPSQASIYCAQTGPEIQIRDLDAIRGSGGKELFSLQKNLNIFQNKTLRVRRVFDEERQVILYVSYSTRLTSQGSGSEQLTSSRYKTSICAIPLKSNPSMQGQSDANNPESLATGQ